MPSCLQFNILMPFLEKGKAGNAIGNQQIVLKEKKKQGKIRGPKESECEWDMPMWAWWTYLLISNRLHPHLSLSFLAPIAASKEIEITYQLH